MRRFALFGALLALLSAGPAAASEEVAVSLFTTATTGSRYDFSGCRSITARCDQSVGDSSTDAKLELLACTSSDSPRESCTVLRNCPSDLPDAQDVPIGSAPTAKPYLMWRTSASPSSDTARGILSCTEIEDGRGCRVVPFAASGTGTYGPYAIKGHTLRFDLDGNATDSSSTTGATAEVTGTTDFGSLTFSSCDLVGGDEACAAIDGTTGNTGFVAVAPRSVSVAITAAANAGTFTLCSW